MIFDDEEPSWWRNTGALVSPHPKLPPAQLVTPNHRWIVVGYGVPDSHYSGGSGTQYFERFGVVVFTSAEDLGSANPEGGIIDALTLFNEPDFESELYQSVMEVPIQIEDIVSTIFDDGNDGFGFQGCRLHVIKATEPKAEIICLVQRLADPSGMTYLNDIIYCSFVSEGTYQREGTRKELGELPEPFPVEPVIRYKVTSTFSLPNTYYGPSPPYRPFLPVNFGAVLGDNDEAMVYTSSVTEADPYDDVTINIYRVNLATKTVNQIVSETAIQYTYYRFSYVKGKFVYLRYAIEPLAPGPINVVSYMLDPLTLLDSWDFDAALFNTGTEKPTGFWWAGNYIMTTEYPYWTGSPTTTLASIIRDPVTGKMALGTFKSQSVGQTTGEKNAVIPPTGATPMNSQQYFALIAAVYITWLGYFHFYRVIRLGVGASVGTIGAAEGWAQIRRGKITNEI